MIDEFLHKQYDKNAYNCAHLVVDAWKQITGVDIGCVMNGFLLPVGKRNAPFRIRHSFHRLDKPKSPCIVLMKRNKAQPHVGLFYNGKVLHITEFGTSYVPLNIASFGFSKIRFYDVDCNIS